MSSSDLVLLITSPLSTIAVYMVYNSFYESNLWGRKIEIFTYIIYEAILLLITSVLNIPIVLIIANLTCLFLLQFNYESALRTKALYTCAVYGLFTIIEMILVVVVRTPIWQPLEENEEASAISIILIRIIILIAARYIYLRKKQLRKNQELPTQYIVALLIILVGTVYFLLSTIVFYDNTTGYLYLVGCAILALLINFSVGYIIEGLQKTFELENERTTLEEQTRAYENQNQLIQSSDNRIREVKHDINNHLMVIGELARKNESGQIEAYISKMITESQEKKLLVNSGNFIFDSLINHKLKDIEKEIQLEIKIEVPQEIKVLSYDITVILGNLIDNALQALENVHNHKKKLGIQASYIKGNLHIYVDNTYEGELLMKDGMYLTAKVEKDQHGIGLQNIMQSLVNYEGCMKITHSQDLFSVAVLVPCD